MLLRPFYQLNFTNKCLVHCIILVCNYFPCTIKIKEKFVGGRKGERAGQLISWTKSSPSKDQALGLCCKHKSQTPAELIVSPESQTVLTAGAVCIRKCWPQGPDGPVSAPVLIVCVLCSGEFREWEVSEIIKPFQIVSWNAWEGSKTQNQNIYPPLPLDLLVHL